MLANPPTPPTVEPPEVATLREMLKEVEDADYDVDLAGWRREQTAALHYALQLYGAVQAHVEALRDAKRLADHGDRRTAAMALNGSNARLAAVLRPANPLR